MLLHVTGRTTGNGRKVAMKTAYMIAKMLIGTPQRPSWKGAEGIEAAFVSLVIRKKTVGIIYEKYNASVASERMASSAAVDAILRS